MAHLTTTIPVPADLTELLADHSLTLQELARAIGISKATLYRFCPTRDQLIDRLIGHAADTLSRALRAAELLGMPAF